MASQHHFFDRIKDYLFNTSWIMGEKFLYLGLSFITTIVVARYLGPKEFGVLTYALSVTTLFASAGHMGLGGLVVREVIRDPGGRSEILGTSLLLKFLGAVIGFASLLAYALVFEERSTIEFWVLIIVALSLFVHPFEIVDFWFQSQIKAKFSAIARSGALLIASLFSILLVFFQAKLIYFSFASLIQTFLGALLFVLLFRYVTGTSITDWRVKLSLAKRLFGQGWVIFLGAVFATIYFKIDQIMIKRIAGLGEVGVYAVAATLSEAWYFVPAAIVSSVFPWLIELRESGSASYTLRLQQTFELLFVIALSVAVLVFLFSKPLILLFFGDQFLASAPILAIHIWTVLFVFMRAAFSKWILIEDVLIYSLITQGLGAVSNVVLNLLLIPRWGGEGAAVATLISYSTASYFSLVFYSRTRPVFWMMTNAITAPIRYPLRALGVRR